MAYNVFLAIRDCLSEMVDYFGLTVPLKTILWTAMTLNEFNSACDHSWALPSALSCLVYYQSLSTQLSS